MAGDHFLQGEDLGVGPRRQARQHYLALHLRKSGTHAFGNGERGIVYIARSEDDLVVRVILLEKALKIVLELLFHAVDGFQNRHGWQRSNRNGQSFCPLLHRHSAIADSACQRHAKKNGGTQRADRSQCDGKFQHNAYHRSAQQPGIHSVKQTISWKEERIEILEITAAGW